MRQAAACCTDSVLEPGTREQRVRLLLDEDVHVLGDLLLEQLHPLLRVLVHLHKEGE